MDMHNTVYANTTAIVTVATLSSGHMTSYPWQEVVNDSGSVYWLVYTQFVNKACYQRELKEENKLFDR